MVTYLLKKSYRLKDYKEIKFNDLWGDHGVFTTMWLFDKPQKILFFDQSLCSIGSYNHNFMGHYGNIELNIDVLNNDFSNEVSKEIKYVLSKSQEITKDDWYNSHTFLHKFLETLSYIFANILAFVSLWFVVRKNDDEE